jgi:hypothetical protein
VYRFIKKVPLLVSFPSHRLQQPPQIIYSVWPKDRPNGAKDGGAFVERIQRYGSSQLV